MKTGYLVFVTSDGDELHVCFITDDDLFNELKNANDNDEALTIWNAKTSKHIGISYQALDTDDYWPFNGYDIKGVAYIMMY